MRKFLHAFAICRLLFVAAPLAIFLMFLFPGTASAHAILLRSVPTRDALLPVAPQEVQMWFSEDLNPTFSTASVINASNVTPSNVNGQRVDNKDAHVSPSDSKEMDLTLQSNLPPAAYIVFYQTDSAIDGHILRGSFIFYVTRPDGSVPTANANALSGQNTFNSSNASGQLDGPTLVSFLMITLVEVAAVFWVGAQLWLNFVLQPAAQDHNEQREISQQIKGRFERRFSLLTLLVLLLANIGVLVGQALNLTGGQWLPAFAPALLVSLATGGQFGIYWMMSEIVILLAIALAVYILFSKQRPRLIDKVLPWTNLLLGLALFMAIAMSGHAAAVSKNIALYAIPLDWLHLLAAALWVGGMMYIATTCLPIIRRQPIAERTESLLTLLAYYSPWALAGVAIMAVTGPFNATFHLTRWDQFITTAYGRALVVKIALIGGLLLTSAIHVGLLRPRLKKEYKKYAYALSRLPSSETAEEPEREGRERRSVGAGVEGMRGGDPWVAPVGVTKLLTQQVKVRERRLAQKTKHLTDILSWEPLLGVGVLICVGLMNVFAGTLTPPPPTSTTTKPFHAIVKTFDNKFTVTLNINPNRFGPNVFTVSVVDNSTGKPTTNVGVSLYTTMLDMDMGTGTVNLLPDGKGHFSATGDLGMGGRWEIRIQVRTPDGMLHETKVDLITPF